MSSKVWAHYPLSATRYKEPAQRHPVTGALISDACALHYGKQPNVGWRFVVMCDGAFSQVGAIYPTKAELLADLPRYAEQWGLV